MPDSAPQTEPTRRKKAWTFLRMFRWAFYLTFGGLILFMAVCAFVGIVANITERYPELEITHADPASAADLSQNQLHECWQALERMRTEDLEQVQEAFTGQLDRDAFLRQYKDWDRQWRKQFEKLGLSCRLTALGPDGRHSLRGLAEIYRRVDDLHKVHQRLVRRYVTENARHLMEIRELLDRTEQHIGLGLDQTPE